MARFYPHPYRSTLQKTLLLNLFLVLVIAVPSLAQSAPTVTSFSPSSGLVGTEVTVTGAGFTTANMVYVGSEATLDFVIINDNQIKVNVPAGAASGRIQVHASQGAGSSSSNFTVNGTPTISSINPTSGPVGTEVIITGSKFTGGTSVSIAGSSVIDFIIISDTEIKVIVPETASGGGARVTANHGSATSSQSFTVTDAPTITSFSPVSGSVGTEVRIFGTKFRSATSVNIAGGTTTNFTIVSDTEIKVKVPSTASGGSVRVYSNGGTAISSTSFTITGIPTLTSFTPVSARVGAEVTINGSGFTTANRVNIGGGSITDFNIVSDTQIKAIVPNTASTGRIQVHTSKGRVASSYNFAVEGAPVISSFSPASGSVGSLVTIKGRNFSEATTVYIGSGSTTNFTIVSDTEIQLVVPSIASSGTLRVYSNSGRASSSGYFTLDNAPVITSFTPASGPAGTEVVVTGSNFTGTSLMYVGNGQITNFTVLSDTEIKLTIPLSATTGSILVRTPNGQTNSSGTFTVTPPALTLTTNELTFSSTTASETKEYQVSGLGLKNGEVVTINLGESSPYEISINAGSGFSKSLTLNTVSNNRLNATSIFVKYTPVGSGEFPEVVSHAQGTITKSLNLRVVAPMPVELKSFAAILKNGEVVLKWSTASERENSHFDIEMSRGTLDSFKKVGKVDSKVTNSSAATEYVFAHYYTGNGQTEYYRLKQVDINGTATYSKVVAVKDSPVKQPMQVAPNPINSESNVYIYTSTGGTATLRVTSVIGKQVYFEQLSLHAGQNIIPLRQSNLGAGVYIISVDYEDKRETIRVVKN